MLTTRFPLAAAFLLGLTAGFCTQTANGDDPKKADISKDKLIGVWESVKEPVQKDDLPKGSTVEFAKDGKLHVEIKAKDIIKIDGTYVLEGDMLKIVLTAEGKEPHKETLKVTKLTDTELVTKDEKNMVDEFKKVVPAKK